MISTFLVEHWQRLPLEGIGLPRRLCSVLLTPRFHASSHIIFFILAEGSVDPILVVKVPRLPGDNECLDREATNLRTVQAARAGGFDSIPRIIAYEDYKDHRLLIETALAGQTMSPARVRRQSQACIEAVLTWLIDLHVSTANRSVPPSRWFERVATHPLDYFENVFLLHPEEKTLLDRTRELTGPLCGSEVPQVFEHGDLSAPNILLSAQGGLGIVDWELAKAHGLPAVDLFFFLTYIAFSRRRARKFKKYIAAFHEAFFGPTAWARPYIMRYAEALQLSPETLGPLFVLCWSRYVATLGTRLHGSNGTEEGLAHGTAVWLRSNRYFALWDHTVRHVHALNIVE
jgi:aminoglycoside phosphotransferase